MSGSFRCYSYKAAQSFSDPSSNELTLEGPLRAMSERLAGDQEGSARGPSLHRETQ